MGHLFINYLLLFCVYRQRFSYFVNLYRDTKFECLFDVAAFCYKGYKDDKEEKNCLKYVPEAVPFPEAEARCQEKGGALFKLDSQKKFDILTDFIGKLRFCMF